jgi:hypothetical protein
MLDAEVGHDRITRFLPGQDVYVYVHRLVAWQQVKPPFRSVENSDTVLAFDETIREKAGTYEA